MSKQLIFWDFDGVIANSYYFVYDYWDKALADRGHQFSVEYYENTFSAKAPFDYLKETFPDAADEIAEAYSQHELDNYPSQVEPFPGFVKAFKNLAPHFQHRVVSSNMEGVIRPSLQRYGILDHFTSIVGRETPGYKNEKIAQILDETGLSPEQCVFVGDTVSDVKHAQSAGVQAIAVSWGIHPRAKLETAHPDYLCDRVDELFILLNSLSLRGAT